MNATEYQGLIKILKKMLLVSGLVGLSVALIIFGIPFSDDNYYLALFGKHNALENTPQPRIILAGGSNLAFGIDSEKMENELNVSVVNTGLHAGIGLNYMLNDLKPYLKERDIIIIIPEYYLLQSDGDIESLSAMTGMNPMSITYLNQKEFLNIHAIGIRLFRHKISVLESDYLKKLHPDTSDNSSFQYSRYGFIQYGDEVSHLKFKSNNTFLFDYISHNVDYSKESDNLTSLNEFNNYAKKRNISVYVSFPPIEEEQYAIYQSDYQNYLNFLKDKLSIKIIGTPEMFKFPKKYFFDTPYHLNSDGRDNRTEILILAIRDNHIT